MQVSGVCELMGLVNKLGSKLISFSFEISHETLPSNVVVAKRNIHVTFIHNLLRLAEKCDLELNDDQKLFLVTVTAFNINARYDDYKMSLQQT